MHNALWLAQTLAPQVFKNVKVPIREMLDGLRMDYKRSTNYQKMWHAKDLVRDWYLGGQCFSFHLIPSLLERIQEVDPDAITDWCSYEGTTVFQRAFICPSANRDALKYCQPVVCLDAAHTKNWKFPMQLFLATALDGLYCQLGGPPNTGNCLVDPYLTVPMMADIKS